LLVLALVVFLVTLVCVGAVLADASTSLIRASKDGRTARPGPKAARNAVEANIGSSVPILASTSEAWGKAIVPEPISLLNTSLFDPLIVDAISTPGPVA
jgi:hypothetical protein